MKVFQNYSTYKIFKLSDVTEKEKARSICVLTHNLIFQCETWRNFIVRKVISPKINFFNDEKSGMIE